MKWLLTAVALSLTTLLPAQNLVPNGSFEEYDTCPDFLNQLHYALYWSSAGLSPDYFNECDVSGYVDVPVNWVGFQNAASGAAYAGGLAWCDFPANRRELLGVALTVPLDPGVPVYLSMKVAVATDGFQESMRWTVPGTGMRFSMTPMFYDQVEPLPDQAALSMAFAPTDTSIWYVVSGTYTPDSAYQYLTVGNFFSDTLITPLIVNPAGTQTCAYVYVDDICVSYDPDFCQSPSSIVSAREVVPLIYPNPASDRINIEREENDAAEIRIDDTQGRTIRSTHVIGKECSIALSGLAPGAYSIRVISAMSDRSTRFIKR